MTIQQRAIPQTFADGSLAGHWKVYTRLRGAGHKDISIFRGVPSTLGDWTFEDPFGPKDMSLTVPEVSYFERRGYGDLDWAQRKTSIDVVWRGALPSVYPFGRMIGPAAAPTFVPWFGWEGYIEDFGYDDSGMQSLCKGAMYQLDNYQAKPEFPHQPLPYEHAIARQFLNKPHLRVGHMLIEWPDWWSNTWDVGGGTPWWSKWYHWGGPPNKKTPAYMIPSGIHPGDNWTGMVTRDTGGWEPALTSYIQKLLQGMYTAHGRWTLDLLRGRIPVLRHHTINLHGSDDTVILNLVHPDVTVSSLSENTSQSLDAIYGSGVSLAGVAYSGQEVLNDGSSSYYVPFAASRQTYPTKENDWLDMHAMPREVYMQFPPGLDALGAGKVARAHYARFASPGVVVELELSGDVGFVNGEVMPAPLLRPGFKGRLDGLFGAIPGPVGHISKVSANLVTGKTSVTVDTKWRDALTINEARLRGRDTLNIPRMLVAGQYTPPLPDQLLPWDYAEGAGQIPYRPDTREFFDRMPNDERFPWTNFTQAHPPSNANWRDAYIRIGPAQTNFTRNWSGHSKHPVKGWHHAVPVRMSQKGSIRLLQLAAYDIDGNVLPVNFHVSFYYLKVTAEAMPEVSAPYNVPGDPAYITGWDTHTGERTPWVPDAWEEYNTDGTLKSTDVPAPVRSAGLWKAYGNSNVKAGYFPGDGTSGTPTGLLVDETNQGFDTEGYGGFDTHAAPGDPMHNSVHKKQGFLYVMIYCDQQATSEVFFLGRMFRAEPGSTIGGS